MNEFPTPRIETSPVLAFKWRDRSGVFHSITDMNTKHLFYTLRMIWNHHMPPVARSFHYKRYSFGVFYTSSYLVQAIQTMLPALLNRQDLEPKWRAEVDRWMTFLGYIDEDQRKLSGPKLLLK